MTARIAVVGSGPAGCYCVERLAKLLPEAEIDVLDRLPTPFGLVRFGVAPDHQGTKAISRVLARALSRPNVAFLGNVEIGRDVTLAELRGLYDAVVLAVGAPRDRRLGVPGEELPGVYGSARFVGWYNGHPDHAGLAPDLSALRRAVVVGNGNVAVDVARVLAKTAEEMAGSDLPSEIAAQIAAAPLEEIVLVGRRDAAASRFTPAELSELGELTRAGVDIAVDDLPDQDGESQAVPALRKLAAAAPEAAHKPLRLRFLFRARPEAFEGESRLRAVRLRRTAERDGRWADTDETMELPAQLAVTCIGYESQSCCDLQPDEGILANEDGRIEDGLYVVGWAKRGPSGTIATNRSDSHAVAQKLADALQPGGKPGGAALRALLAERGCDPVDLEGWQRIDLAETGAAGPGRVRAKIVGLEALLAAARG
jgi:ferredoxin--NADP+ reductase